MIIILKLHAEPFVRFSINVCCSKSAGGRGNCHISLFCCHCNPSKGSHCSLSNQQLKFVCMGRWEKWNSNPGLSWDSTVKWKFVFWEIISEGNEQGQGMPCPAGSSQILMSQYLQQLRKANLSLGVLCCPQTWDWPVLSALNFQLVWWQHCVGEHSRMRLELVSCVKLSVMKTSTSFPPLREGEALSLRGFFFPSL